jgi:hypothetical protein
MAMTKRARVWRKATAYHEAGHAVVTWLRGGTTNRVTIVPGDGYLGMHEPRRLSAAVMTALAFGEDSAPARRALERGVMSFLAGEIAEYIGMHRPASGKAFSARVGRNAIAFMKKSGQIDVQNALNWLSVACHYKGKKTTPGLLDDRSAYFEWLARRAYYELASNWDLVDALASELRRVGTLSRKRVKEVIGKAILARQRPALVTGPRD